MMFTVYENEEQYNSIIVPKLADDVASKFGYDGAFNKDGTLREDADFVALLFDAVAKDYDCYIWAKRKTITSLYSSNTSEYIKKHVNYSTEYVGDVEHLGRCELNTLVAEN